MSDRIYYDVEHELSELRVEVDLLRDALEAACAREALALYERDAARGELKIALRMLGKRTLGPSGRGSLRFDEDEAVYVAAGRRAAGLAAEGGGEISRNPPGTVLT